MVGEDDNDLRANPLVDKVQGLVEDGRREVRDLS